MIKYHLNQMMLMVKKELYIIEYSDYADDFILEETIYSLEDIHKLKKENKKDKQKIIKREQKQLNILDFIEKLSHFSHTIDDIM